MKKIIGNQQLVRVTNQNLIIETVRKNGPISRAELSKLLKLSAPTVSSNIDKLIGQGILIEVGEGDSNGGRKPIMLDFNYNYGNVVGIDLSGEELKIALGNLKPEILHETSLTIPEKKNGEQILQWIIEKVDKILADKNDIIKKVMAISIAFPGVVDGKTGHVKSSKRFGEWSKLNIKKVLEEHFDVPLLIKNDVNVAVLGELWYGSGSGYSNLVYIGVDVGLGAGIVINGALYEGSHYDAGEISQLVFGLDSLDDKCEEYIYLEPAVSIAKMVNGIRNSLKEGVRSQILELVNGEADKINFNHVVKALQLGDDLCLEHTTRCAKILGIAISNLANILDVELIIIGNEVIKLGSQFIETIRSVVNRFTTINPTIIYSQLNTETIIYGTFAVCLDYIFNNIIE